MNKSRINETTVGLGLLFSYYFVTDDHCLTYVTIFSLRVLSSRERLKA